MRRAVALHGTQSLAIDGLKEQLQATQATKVVEKLFAMPHNAILTTPTGEFAQIIGKVFRNLDTLLPSLYGAVIPIFLEVFVAVILIGILYGWIALAQLGLVLVYTIAVYRAAKKKAQRNKDMMTVMFSEWGKIMDTASSCVPSVVCCGAQTCSLLLLLCLLFFCGEGEGESSGEKVGLLLASDTDVHASAPRLKTGGRVCVCISMTSYPLPLK